MMLALFIGLPMLATALWITVGWLACSGWNARRWARDWEDSRKAWQDVRDYHEEILSQRAEMLAIAEALTGAEPEQGATSPAPYPGTTWPCLIHGSHQADERCGPPDDTDWLASSGIRAFTDTEKLINDFRRRIEEWEATVHATNSPQIGYPDA